MFTWSCSRGWCYGLTCVIISATHLHQMKFLPLVLQNVSLFGNMCMCVCVCLPTHMCMLCHFSSVWLFATLWMVAHHTSLSVGFSRQEYWHGLPCPSPGGLPVLGIEPRSPTAHALQADSLGLSHQGSPKLDIRPLHKLSVDLGCGLTGVEGTSNPVWRVSLWRGN